MDDINDWNTFPELPKIITDENLIGYIIVRGGNHRIVMTKKNKLKNKIYTKFMFNNDSNIL